MIIYVKIHYIYIIYIYKCGYIYIYITVYYIYVHMATLASWQSPAFLRQVLFLQEPSKTAHWV